MMLPDKRTAVSEWFPFRYEGYLIPTEPVQPLSPPDGYYWRLISVHSLEKSVPVQSGYAVQAVTRVMVGYWWLEKL